jgi:AcrR family transcriptional regulator
LLDAGFRLLEEEGPEALTIAAVSARAGVSAGTVYRRFGDKEGLLAGLQREFTDGFRQEFSALMTRNAPPEGASARAAIEVAVRALADTYVVHQRLMRVFVVLGLRDERVLATGREASREGGRAFRDLLWPYRASFSRDDHEHAIDLAYRTAYAACTHLVLHGTAMESATELTWDHLADELCRTVALLLLGTLPERDPAGRDPAAGGPRP